MSQFPNSNFRRRGLCFVRLLERVDPVATHGFGFHGQNYRPGSRIPASELPVPALVLECANTGSREANHLMWLLWHFDFCTNSWIEMARTSASDWTWALALRPLAVRLLKPQSISYDCGAITRELTLSIEEALQKVPHEVHGDLLTRLDVYLSQQVARL